MAWQTSGVMQNGPSCGALHQPKAEQLQWVVSDWRFNVAPMIDWTDEIFSVVFPQ